MMDTLKWMSAQGGSVTPMMAAFLFFAMILCLLVSDVGLYLVSGQRARNAADAAALGAVQEAFPLFSTGCGARAAAEQLARRNHASLVKVGISEGGEKAVVEVEVRPSSILLRRLGIGAEKVRAVAAAEVDIGALMESGEVWYTRDPAKLSSINAFLLKGTVRDRGRASTLVALLALQHLGKPYVWGAAGPDGFDCSGLVCYVYAQIGITLPRVTFAQVRFGRAVAPAELAPGDLVFFRRNGHVGIYLGGGRFVHAPHRGDVVRISALGARADLSACRRII